MEEFEHRAITTAVNPSSIWKRYVNDTFVIQRQLHIEEFLKHINSVDPSIQFTVEESTSDSSVPFPDTIMTPKADEIFTTGVYRKPTHTGLYQQWDSHHNLESKYTVIYTLTHRAKAVCSTPELFRELHHLEMS